MALLRLQHFARPDRHLLIRIRRIMPVVASVQCANQLRKDSPHELFLSQHVPLFQLLDVAAQVAVAAVLHVQMDVGRALDVLSGVVLDDVGMAEVLEDLQFCCQLVALPVGHAVVADLFAAEDGIVFASADLVDDAERALAWVGQ